MWVHEHLGILPVENGALEDMTTTIGSGDRLRVVGRKDAFLKRRAHPDCVLAPRILHPISGKVGIYDYLTIKLPPAPRVHAGNLDKILHLPGTDAGVKAVASMSDSIGAGGTRGQAWGNMCKMVTFPAKGRVPISANAAGPL